MGAAKRVLAKVHIYIIYGVYKDQLAKQPKLKVGATQWQERICIRGVKRAKRKYGFVGNANRIGPFVLRERAKQTGVNCLKSGISGNYNVVYEIEYENNGNCNFIIDVK